MLPGKDFPDILICSGTNPNFDKQGVYKSVYGNTIFKIISLLLHFLIIVRINIFKWTSRTNEQPHPRSKTFWQFFLKRNSFIKVAESVFQVVLGAISVSMHGPRKQRPLELMNHECMDEYIYTFIRPALSSFLMVGSKYFGDRDLRQALRKEFQIYRVRNLRVPK